MIRKKVKADLKVDGTKKRPKKPDKSKYNCKFTDVQVRFVLQKIAEGLLSDWKICDLFNRVYNDNPKIPENEKITIAKSTVGSFRVNPLYAPIIYDYRCLTMEEIKEGHTYANLNVQMTVLTEELEKARTKNDTSSVVRIMELIAKISGSMDDKVVINNSISMGHKEAKEFLAELDKNLDSDYM